MPGWHPDILDHTCVLFLFCLFCAVRSVKRLSRLIIPSIRRPVMESATSAQQRRFRHKSGVGSGFAVLTLPTSCRSFVAGLPDSKSTFGDLN